MKITQAIIFPLSIPLIEPIKMAKEVIIDAKTVLVCLTDENGRQGWGEASVAPLMTGETLDSLFASIRYLAEKVRAIAWSDPSNFLPNLIPCCMATHPQSLVLRWPYLICLRKKNQFQCGNICVHSMQESM